MTPGHDVSTTRLHAEWSARWPVSDSGPEARV